MMHLTHRFLYAAHPDLAIAELPFVGGRFVMDIVLPKLRNGLNAIEKTFSFARFQTWLSGLQVRNLDLRMPKFKIAPASSYRLAGALKKLGMTLAFDAKRADFSGIAPFETEAQRLFIHDVYHQAFIDVHERGTEAAAATAVVMGVQGIAAKPSPPNEFLVDRPFLFVIRDQMTGMILFIGRLAAPSAVD